MTASGRILWGEGLFLRPQHFQQQALFFESTIAQGLRQVHAHPWGVRNVTFDVEALRGGTLLLNTLDIVFGDGTDFSAPFANPLPASRNLADIGHIGTETTVYACLPVLNGFGGNCAENDGTTARRPRYLTARTNCADLYTEALEAEVTTLHPNVRLMVEEENRDGHLSLAIGRLAKNASGSWEVVESFIPPLVEIGGNHYLATSIRRLLDILVVKNVALAARHREKVKSIVEYGTSDIASFWLLHTVNRSFPLLRHFASVPTHPETLYGLMAQLCGELMTFSSELTLKEIPAYDHEDLTHVFGRLDTMIRELLETVVSDRYAIIPLDNTKPSFLVGRLDSERLVENVDYYLSVSSDLPTTQILETVPLKLKAGSPDDVEKILNSALPGVRLVHATQTPVALPVRVGNHYFVLEPQGQIFDRMKKSRSICIYVPQALLQIKLELFAVFH
ncbi:type VI secretion system baseplate subunit TssK [Propionivibrio soli]|uniref:type VI secretion system baseplate subunit TssK n=1 Tax=Propionivibrio soli TaxID=2976531 RepID=UPI0021E7BD8D|nr:type VI secretion system baseplate subunit TssK [Propionivibrio soli]